MGTLQYKHKYFAMGLYKALLLYVHALDQRSPTSVLPGLERGREAHGVLGGPGDRYRLTTLHLVAQHNFPLAVHNVMPKQ